MKPLLLNRKLTMFFALSGFFLIILGSWFKINSLEINFLNGHILLIPGIVLHSIAFIVVLYDLIVNPVKNKSMWLTGIFVFSSVTVIFYLMNRDSHMKPEFNPHFNKH